MRPRGAQEREREKKEDHQVETWRRRDASDGLELGALRESAGMFYNASGFQHLNDLSRFLSNTTSCVFISE